MIWDSAREAICFFPRDFSSRSDGRRRDEVVDSAQAGFDLQSRWDGKMPIKSTLSVHVIYLRHYLIEENAHGHDPPAKPLGRAFVDSQRTGAIPKATGFWHRTGYGHSLARVYMARPTVGACAKG